MIGDGKELDMKITPQVIRKDGRSEFVVLPYDEYEAIRERLADADDLLELRKAKRQDDPTKAGLTLKQLKSRLGFKGKGSRPQTRARRTRARRKPR